MADDLVKRLREAMQTHFLTASKPDATAREAADRIEALEAQLAQVTRERDELDFLLHEGGPDSVANIIARAERAEAKLAKAVAALRLYDRGYWLAEEPGGVILDGEAEWPFDHGQHAAAVLAEIAPTEEPTP